MAINQAALDQIDKNFKTTGGRGTGGQLYEGRNVTEMLFGKKQADIGGTLKSMAGATQALGNINPAEVRKLPALRDDRVRNAYAQRDYVQSRAEQALADRQATDAFLLPIMAQGEAQAGNGAAAMNLSNKATQAVRDSAGNILGGDWLSSLLAGSAKSYAAGFANIPGDIAQLGGASEREQELTALNAQLWGETDPTKRAQIEERINYLNANPGADNEVRKGEYYQTADRLALEAARERAQADKYAPSIVNDVISGGLQMGADIGIGALTGGGTLLPMTVRGYGGGSQEARQQGANYGQSVMKGAASALTSYLTEQISGIGTSKITGVEGTLDDAIDNVIAKAVNRFAKTAGGQTALNAALQGISSFLGEGLEEGIEALAQPAIDLITDKNALKQYGTGELYEDAVYEALVGGLVGLLANGVQQVGGQYKSDRAGYEGVNRMLNGTATEQDVTNLLQSEAAMRQFERSTGVEPTALATVGDMLRVAREAGAAQEKAQKNTAAETGAEQLANKVQQAAGRRQGEPLQVNNVDNTTKNGYSEINGGGYDAEFGRNDSIGRENRSQSGTGTGIPTGQGALGEVDAGRAVGQRNPGVRLVIPLSEESKQTLNERGVVSVELNNNSADNAAFSTALDEARATDAKNGWAVTPKTMEELANVRTFMDEKGTTGFAIAEDGDIEAVFANKAKGAPKGATQSTIPQAIANGGTKLDCYGTKLVDLYTQYGFVPVARVAFNSEYANEGWTPDKGAPDIYFMMHNGDSADTVVRNYRQYKMWTKEELDALPLMEYDDAYAYRDALLSKVNAPQNDGVGAMNNPYPTEQKVSQASSNTLTRTYKEAIRTMEESQRENISGLTYDPITEAQSMKNAQERLYVDLEGEMLELPTKEAWNGEDLDAAMGIMDRLMYEAMDSGDYTEVNRWAKIIQEKGTQAGQFIQAFAKYNRSPAGMLVEVSEFLDSENVRKTVTAEKKNEILRDVQDYLRRIEETGNTLQSTEGSKGTPVSEGKPNAAKDLIGIISELNEKRRTTGIFKKDTGDTMTKALEYIAKTEGGVDFLRDVARQQALSYAYDYAKTSPLNAAKTLRTNNLLSRFSTIVRNITSNTAFDISETLSNNSVVWLDELVSKATGKRSIAVDRSWFSSEKRRGSREALVKSYIEIGLDADTTRGAYEGIGDGRTFKANGNFAERVLSSYEKWLGYGLKSTDEFAKGGVEAEYMRGMEALAKKGKAVNLDEARARAAEVAKQRTFQNDSTLSKSMNGMRSVLNNMKIEDGQGGSLGVGDVVLPFATVPGNVAQQAINYSPIGLAKGMAQLSKVLIDAKSGEVDINRQGDAVMSIGRGLTGTAGIAAFTALALTGIIAVAGDDDKDKEAVMKAQGATGTQMNLSAFKRWIAGQDTAWRDGDKLISIGFLEPLNAQMAMGAMIAEAYEDDGTLSAGEMLNANLASVITSVTELPAMSQIQNIADAYTYSDAETTAGKLADAGLSFTGSQVSGFAIPNAVAGIAAGTDMKARDEYSAESALGEVWDHLKADIPGLRQTLPAKTDSFGKEITYGDEWISQLLGATVLPGRIASYKSTKATEELGKLSGKVGSVAYPDKAAPKSFTVNGETYELSNTERQYYRDTANQVYWAMLDTAVESDVYNMLPAEMKADLISSIKTYANATAKQAIKPEYELSADMQLIGELSRDEAIYYLAGKDVFKEAESGDETDTFIDFVEMWSKVPKAAQDALNDVSGFEKYKTVADEGIDLGWYNTAKEVWSDSTKANRDRKLTEEEIHEILGLNREWRTMGEKQKDVAKDAIGSKFGDAMEAITAGVEPELWFEAYNKYSEVGKQDASASAKETDFNYWLETLGLTDRQEDVLNGQFNYYAQVRGTDEAYQTLKDAGLDSETAKNIYYATTGLETEEKKAAIIGLGLDDKETVAALSTLVAEGKKDKYSTAYNYGISPKLVYGFDVFMDEKYPDKSASRDRVREYILQSEARGDERSELYALLVPSSVKSGNIWGSDYPNNLNWVIAGK